MIDFDNREYLRISAYWKNWAVCFVMENGLAYLVSTKPPKEAFPIAIAICSGSHTKMMDPPDDIYTMPEHELKRAEYNLKHGKLNRWEYFQKAYPYRGVHWLKWTEKYKAEIHNLKSYYEEKLNHCPTPVNKIPIDFENREYVEVAGYWPETYVCFVMKNGLSYCVDIEKKIIYIDVHPYAHFNDYGAFFKDAAEIPKTELEIAENLLRSAKLPDMREEDVKAFLFWFQLHRNNHLAKLNNT